jgi:hypothetical protein
MLIGVRPWEPPTARHRGDAVSTEPASPRLLAFWWRCIEAGHELDNDDAKLPDDALVLHYQAHGTTCMVFARDMRAAVALIDKVTEQ